VGGRAGAGAHAPRARPAALPTQVRTVARRVPDGPRVGAPAPDGRHSGVAHAPSVASAVT